MLVAEAVEEGDSVGIGWGESDVAACSKFSVSRVSDSAVVSAILTGEDVATVGGPPNDPVSGVAGGDTVGTGTLFPDSSILASASIDSGCCPSAMAVVGVVIELRSGRGPRGTPAKKKPIASNNKASAYPVNALTRRSILAPLRPIRFSILGDWANRARIKANKAPKAEIAMPHKVQAGKPIRMIISSLVIR